MSGRQLTASGSHQQNRLQLALVGQGHGLGQQFSQQQQPPLLLDLNDLVLDGVKCHLNLGRRIGFEPISERFMRLAFFIKQRAEMKLHGRVWDAAKRTSYLDLEVTTKTGCRKKTIYHIYLTKDGARKALQSLFLHVPKWRSVDFSFYGLGERIVADMHVMVGHLLDAMLADSSANSIGVYQFAYDRRANNLLHGRSSIDIRRLSCGLVDESIRERLTTVVQSGAAHLRSLFIDLRHWGDWQAEGPTPILDSIGACQQLRQLKIVCSSSTAGKCPPSFLPMLAGRLPKLTTLRLSPVYEDVLIERSRLTVAAQWLPLLAQPALQPLLKKFQSLTVDVNRTDLSHGSVAAIVAEMRAPAKVLIRDVRLYVPWAVIWGPDYLPTIYSTGAQIELLADLGMLRVTAAVFATGRARLPAMVQAALIPPDLNSANDRYRKLEFRFPNGGQLTVKGR